MKINLSKLSQSEEKDSKLNLSKVSTEETPKEEDEIKPATLSLDKLSEDTNNTETSATRGSSISLHGLSKLSAPQETPKTPEQTGFSLTFTENKVYDLDEIIRIKKRDNKNCPLILYVNEDDEQDREITELIITLILDKYLNANKNESDKYSLDFLRKNYPSLINQVPNFYQIFNSYFNKYYQYYYTSIQNSKEGIEGSISLDTIKINIIDSYQNNIELYNPKLKKFSYNAPVLNKPRIEYEMGTEPTPDDVTPSTEYFGLKAQDNKLFISYQNEIIPGQTGIPFATVNNQMVLNSSNNIETLTLEDYYELIQGSVLFSEDHSVITDSDGKTILSTNK